MANFRLQQYLNVDTKRQRGLKKAYFKKGNGIYQYKKQNLKGEAHDPEKKKGREKNRGKEIETIRIDKKKGITIGMTGKEKEQEKEKDKKKEKKEEAEVEAKIAKDTSEDQLPHQRIDTITKSKDQIYLRNNNLIKKAINLTPTHIPRVYSE